MAEPVAPRAHAHFQYASAGHQAGTAIAGMWLFLASEVLFFGGLILVWIVLRRGHPSGFALAAGHANLLIGAVNTALLVTSSTAYAWGLEGLDRPGNGATDGGRRMRIACLVTAALGAAFLALKGLEWGLDLREGLFPGAGFRPDGPDRAGAQLFYAFYFVATGLHGVHMLVGIALVCWVAWRVGTARRERLGRHDRRRTAAEAVGLYWSFVDLVWMVLFPLIYVVDRT